MNVELRKWTRNDRLALKRLCNDVDRTFLSDRMPLPYSDEDAEWWLSMVGKSEGIDGTFRAVVVTVMLWVVFLLSPRPMSTGLMENWAICY